MAELQGGAGRLAGGRAVRPEEALLREDKGYTYGVYSRGDARRLAGVSYIVGSVKADVTGAALKELLKELGRLRSEPVSQAELDDAKNALVLGLPADFATAGAIAGRLGELAVYGLPAREDRALIAGSRAPRRRRVPGAPTRGELPRACAAVRAC